MASVRQADGAMAGSGRRGGVSPRAIARTILFKVGMLVIACAALVSAVAAAQLQHEYVYRATWGTTGSDPGQFRSPAGIAAGSDAIYVADSDNNRVQKFSLDGTLVRTWGGLGNAVGLMNHPWGIAVAGSRVYVADTNNARIQVFDNTGTVLAVWPTPGSSPAGIAANDSRVYVSDTLNHRILVYSSDGVLVATWGGYGGLYGQFFMPAGVALSNDSVYVADRGNHRIQRLTLTGTFVSAFGAYGSRCWEFDSPVSVSVLGSGNLLIADQATGRVSEMTAGGGCVTWWGDRDGGQGWLQSAVGVASDGSGRVYVSDGMQNVLKVYAYHELAMTRQVFLPVMIKATRSLYEVHVNAGDGGYLDSQGVFWQADQEYRAGGWGYVEKASSIFTTSHAIAGTADPSLYQSERYSMAGYAFDVPVGFYEVTFKFAEIFYDRAGQRIFSVRVEEQHCLDDLDIYAEAGHDRALDKTCALAVTDGQLNIDFIPKRHSDAPKISAVAVRQLSEHTEVTPTPTPPSERTASFAARDTFIDFYSSTVNMSALQYLAIRPYREDQGRASLLWFDVSSLPANATVLDAGLGVHVTDRTNVNALYVGAYRLLRPWTVTETTWISATQNSAWSQPGANGEADRLPVPEDALAMDAAGAWYTFTMPSLVQAWIDHPQQNFGVTLQGSPGGAVEYRFESAETGRSDFAPRLVVLYTTQPQGPTRTPTASSTPTQTPVPTQSATATRTATPTTTGTATPTPSVTVVALQQGLDGYVGVDDTWISSWAPEANYGSHPALYIRSNDVLASMLRYDLSQIPRGAEIEDATLSVYAYNSSWAGLLVADVYGVVRPWNVNEVTWISASQSITWTEPGCNDPGSDRGAVAVDVQGFDSVGHWYSFSVSSLVEGWVRDPASNNGLILKGRPGDPVQYSISSSDAVYQALRPILTISYRLAETGDRR